MLVPCFEGFVLTLESLEVSVSDAPVLQRHLPLAGREHGQRAEHEQLQRPADPGRLLEQCRRDGHRWASSAGLRDTAVVAGSGSKGYWEENQS